MNTAYLFAVRTPHVSLFARDFELWTNTWPYQRTSRKFHTKRPLTVRHTKRLARLSEILFLIIFT